MVHALSGQWPFGKSKLDLKQSSLRRFRSSNLKLASWRAELVQVDQNLEGYQKIKMATPTSDLKWLRRLLILTSSSVDLDNQLVAKKRRRSADMVALGVTYNQALYEDDTLGGGNLSSG